MLLAVDIGNTSIKFGLFEGEKLTSKFSVPTQRDATPDEIKLDLADRMPKSIESAIVCSVVPEIGPAIRSVLRDATSVEPVFVNNSFDFGLKINYEPLDSLGTDRLVTAYSAVEKYGAPCIVCSLGTATTIDVVSGEREFLGGIIAPGVDSMAEALHLKAPRLPVIEVSRPVDLLGRSTEESINTGIYHGYVAMVEGLIGRARTQTGVGRAIATGGNAVRLSEEFGGILIVEEDLLLEGLRRLSF